MTALVAAMTLAHCSSATRSACAPGASVSCTCPGGAQGAQVCQSDGSGYEACVCQGAGSTTPTCAQAFDHLYAEECEAVVDGTDLTESQAIDFCTQSQTQVSGGSCPCGSDQDAYLSCASTLTVCGTCSDEFSAWDSCLNANAGCGSTPTCAQAFDNLYGEDCEAVVDGTDLTESQAIDFCTQSQTEVSGGSCPCGSDQDAYLSCASTLTVCGSCSDEFSAWDSCLNANAGCSP
jgi:hypothetical protein